MKELTEAWLKIAGTDLEAAEVIRTREDLTNVVTFHCHQCVEKILKAVLIEFDLDVPRIHDLVTLYNMVKDKIKVDLEMLNQVNRTYIDTRYPGDEGLLPEGFPSLAKAQSFYEFANDVMEQVKELLKSKDEEG